MLTLLPPWPMLSAFILASLALTLTPGPAVLYIIARSAMQGRGSALASVAGVALGNLANALFAALGLAALFAFSSLAYDVVRYVGAGYLVFMGIRTILSASNPASIGPVASESPARIFRDGAVVALFNPKTTIFFAAFLPQFVAHADVHPAEIMLLGSIFVAIAACTDSLYALASTTISRSVHFPDRMVTAGKRMTGAIFIGLGIFTVISGRRT